MLGLSGGRWAETPGGLNAVTPYYEHAGITIWHGDCREILPGIGPVDLVLTDPPYGVGMQAFQDDFSIVPAALEACPSSLLASFISPRRIVELANALTSWNFGRLLWMDKSADIAYPWRGWCMNGEAIMIFSRKGAVWPEPVQCSTDCYRVGPWERAGHPNGKPISVIKDIIGKIGGPLIIDPFMGSGTTLRAAKDLGRHAIGIEIEERYCEIAARRMEQGVLALEP